MSELTDFLEARLAEDAEVARATLAGFDLLDWSDNWGDAWHMHGPVDGPSGYVSLVVDPARVLVEVEAKRAIVAEHPLRWYTDEEPGFGMWMNDHPCKPPAPCRTLRLLASVYRDHPGYQEGWAL